MVKGVWKSVSIERCGCNYEGAFVGYDFGAGEERERSESCLTDGGMMGS